MGILNRNDIATIIIRDLKEKDHYEFSEGEGERNRLIAKNEFGI